jgi:hypothetical protein
MKKRIALGWAVYLVCFGACEDSSGTQDLTPGTGGSTVTLEGMPAALGKTFCQKAWSCCSMTELAASPLVGTDVASCQTTITAFLALGLSDVKDSVTKGRAAYHGDKLASCLKALDAESCDLARSTNVVASLTAACKGAFEPRVAVGGGCVDHADCIDGFCDGPATASLGTCTARKADTIACVSDAECSAGACSANACAKPIAGGSALCQ